MRALVAMMAALFAITPHQARAGFAGMGMGTATCAEYAQEYRKAPKQIEMLFFSWAQGYLSGINTGHIADHKPTADLASISTDDQESRIRSYCDQHPLLTYAQAVLVLYYSLPQDKEPTR